MSVKQISKLRIKKGLSENLPISLSEAEMAFTTDTGEVFIGAPNFERIEYRSGSGNTNDSIYPYQNIKILTEFDFPKAITSDYYTMGPLKRVSIPVTSTPSQIYKFDSGLDAAVINYSLYSLNLNKTIYCGILKMYPDNIYGDVMNGITFSTSYDGTAMTLSSTNTTDSILVMNMSAQTWQTMRQTNV